MSNCLLPRYRFCFLSDHLVDTLWAGRKIATFNSTDTPLAVCKQTFRRLEFCLFDRGQHSFLDAFNDIISTFCIPPCLRIHKLLSRPKHPTPPNPSASRINRHHHSLRPTPTLGKFSVNVEVAVQAAPTSLAPSHRLPRAAIKVPKQSTSNRRSLDSRMRMLLLNP